MMAFIIMKKTMIIWGQQGPELNSLLEEVNYLTTALAQ